MNFETLQRELREILRDPTVDHLLGGWLNDVVLEVAAMYELPTLRLRVPATLAVVNTTHIFNLSAATHVSSYTYMKRCFRITSSTVEQGFTLEPSVTLLDDVDPDHSDTGTSVQRIAVEADQIAVYPRATENLSVWFYRTPATMVNPTAEPDGIPAPYHYKVLVPMVVLRAVRDYPNDRPYGVLGDNTKLLVWWTTRLNQGLYGDGIMPGMLHYIQKAQRVQTPRLRGAMLGGRLGGNYPGGM